jgi:RNA polymerase sigma-70 factor (sigma-E family)
MAADSPWTATTAVQAAVGARPAWESLYSSQWLPMVRLAALLVDDRFVAEDVVQDAFIGLHRNYANVQDPAAVVAYLRQSVVNGARSVLRRRRVMRRHILNRRLREVDGSSTNELVVSDENLDLMNAVRGLTRRQREVVVLRYWLRLSEAEIAAALGVSTGTIKSTASLAVSNLKSKLGVIG